MAYAKHASVPMGESEPSVRYTYAGVSRRGRQQHCEQHSIDAVQLSQFTPWLPLRKERPEEEESRDRMTKLFP